MDTSLQIMTWGSPKTGKYKKTQICHENRVFQESLNYLSKTMVFHLRCHAFSTFLSKITDFLKFYYFL